MLLLLLLKLPGEVTLAVAAHQLDLVGVVVEETLLLMMLLLLLLLATVAWSAAALRGLCGPALGYSWSFMRVR